MKAYKLLTPGPLTTTDTVKKEMMFDHCTWDDDYKAITQKIRRELLELAHVSGDDYTAVLMQGSGTFGVEAVLSSVIGEKDKLLILANGAYGERMGDIARYHNINYIQKDFYYDSVPDAAEVEEILKADASVTHVSMVHSETTTGILNDIESVGRAAKKYGKTFIVDAMSSFGGVDIPVRDYGVDFIVSRQTNVFRVCRGFRLLYAAAKSLLSRRAMREVWLLISTISGKRWIRMASGDLRPLRTRCLLLQGRLTSSVRKAVFRRETPDIQQTTDCLSRRWQSLGFKSYINEKYQSPIITTFFYPEGMSFGFSEMYKYIKDRGYAIYPGKLTDANTFRIGNIGEIYEADINKLIDIFADFLESRGMPRGQMIKQ